MSTLREEGNCRAIRNPRTLLPTPQVPLPLVHGSWRQRDWRETETSVPSSCFAVRIASAMSSTCGASLDGVRQLRSSLKRCHLYSGSGVESAVCSRPTSVYPAARRRAKCVGRPATGTPRIGSCAGQAQVVSARAGPQGFNDGGEGSAWPAPRSYARCVGSCSPARPA